MQTMQRKFAVKLERLLPRHRYNAKRVSNAWTGGRRAEFPVAAKDVRCGPERFAAAPSDVTEQKLGQSYCRLGLPVPFNKKAKAVLPSRQMPLAKAGLWRSQN